MLEYYGAGEDFAWGDSQGVVEFGPQTLHDIRSVTKSVTALLYGTALGDGMVPPPTESLLRSFPQYPDLAADPRRARPTVEHALTMSLGVEWREDIPYTNPANGDSCRRGPITGGFRRGAASGLSARAAGVDSLNMVAVAAMACHLLTTAP